MAKNRMDLLKDEFGSKAIILVIGILAVIFVAALALNALWTSDDKDEENTTQTENSNAETQEISNVEFGTFAKVSNGQEKILKEYFSEIFMTLSSGNKQEVYEITAEDYVSKHNYNVDTLYNALKKKGIVGKAFECTEYAVAKNPRFGRVFSLEMVSIDKKVIDRLIIIEESPRHFKISFDGYVGTEKQNVEVTREGLKLNILNAEEYKDRVHFKIKITNVSEDIIVMNSQNRASEPVYVLLSNDKKIYNSDDIFVTKSITLKPGESFEAEMTFYTVDLQAARIKKLYIIDVYNETSKSTTTFEYDIY